MKKYIAKTKKYYYKTSFPGSVPFHVAIEVEKEILKIMEVIL